MLLGLILMFAGSVTFTNRPARRFIAQLPIAHPREQALGGDVTYPVLPTSRPLVPVERDKTVFDKPLSAASAIVVDDRTNTVLFSLNAEAVRPLASISKLMSALVLNDLNLDWATTTIITTEESDGSDHHTNVGEEFTLEDLWHIALVGSSNSAIEALVHASGLTEDGFVALMNKKAADFNLSSMRFAEPTGLNSDNVGSASDVARLLKEALRVDKIFTTLQIGEYYAHPINNDKSRRVWTTDSLLTNLLPSDFDKDTIAGKTGYIVESGYNFTVRLADNKHHTLRVVVLGANSNQARFSEARDLAEWTFSHYVWPDEAGYGKLVE